MKTKRIIINADDCGMSKTVDEHIEKAIIERKITSTTIMANMDDYEGAVALYKKFGNQISFGWHINLTEGSPLLNNQLLLDKGYYAEHDGKVIFNGRKFSRKKLSIEMKEAIMQELRTQYEKLCDSGICISHVDSHHHVHTSRSLILTVPTLLDELKITRMRRRWNYEPYSLDYFARNLVMTGVSFLHPKIRMTDTLCNYEEFIKKTNLPSGNTIELECHPGHPKYQNEENLLYDTDLRSMHGIELISYLEL